MEEKVSTELKQCELKQEIARRTMNDLQEKASSVLLLCLQWKEVENHFDSIRGLIEVEREEVERKERVVNEREKEVGVKEKRVEELVKEVKLKDEDFKESRRELELKEMEFGVKVRERYDEVELKEKKVEGEFREVALREKRAEKRFIEAEVKERRAGELFKEVRVKDEEFREWRKGLDLKEKEIELKGREVEERFKEIELMKKNVGDGREEIELNRRKLEEGFRELELKSREFEERIKGVELKEKELEEQGREVVLDGKQIEEREIKDFESKEKQLVAACNARVKRVEELVKEVKLKDEDFKEWRRALELKEMEFGVKVRERYDEVELKEKKVEGESREVALREKSVEKRFIEVEVKERRVGELFKEVGVKDEAFREWRKELELKQKEIELKGREVEERIKEIELMEKDVGDGREEIELNRRKLEAGFRELELKSREVEVRFKEIELMEKNVADRSEEIELNRRKLEEGFRELELRSREVEERIKGVELKEKEFEEQRREVVLKGKQIEEVELKEKKLEERLRHVELENKKCTERIKEFESKEKQLVEASEARVKLEPVDHSMDANLRFSVKMDGKALQIFLNERCTHIDKMKNEVFVALGLSKDDVEFKEAVVRRSCNLLLEQLMKISPPIKPHVRKEAMRLAFNWMTKMRVDDQQYLEVLGFFNLLAAYGLGSAFDSDELISRFVTIARNRMTLEFLRFLGLADKIPGKFLMLEVDGESVPPGPLLRDYLNGSKIEARRIRRSSESVEAQIEATNKRLAVLMVVLKCVEDYKLESEFSPDRLRQQIKDVERQHLNRNTKLSNLGCNSQPPNLSEKKCLAPRVASSSPVLASNSVSATKPALKSMAAAAAVLVTVTSPSPTAASIASPFGVTSRAPMAPSVNPVAPIAVASTSTTAASTATSTVFTSPSSTTASITAFTSRSTVACPSSTSASPPALIPKTEPQCQGGNKRSLLQYKDCDKCPQEQHQGRNKRHRSAHSVPLPHQATKLPPNFQSNSRPSLFHSLTHSSVERNRNSLRFRFHFHQKLRQIASLQGRSTGREREKETEAKEKEFEERCREFIEVRDAEVEEHFKEIEFTKKGLEERCREFELKEKEFEERCEEMKFVEEIEVKGKRIEERRNEVEERQELVKKKFVEIKLKEKQVDERCREVELESRKFVEEVGLKEKQLDKRRKEIEVESKRIFEELELKEKEFEERCKKVELENKKFVEQFEFKEKRLSEGRREVAWAKMKFGEQLKQRELEERRLEDRALEIELEKKRNKEFLEELELKQKQAEQQRKEVDLEIMKNKKFIEEEFELERKKFIEKLELKEKEFDEKREEVELERKKFIEEFELKEKQFEKRREEVALERRKFIEEFELKEKQFDERREEVELEKKKFIEKLELKEKQFDEKREEFELERRKFIEQLEFKEKQFDERREEVELERKKLIEKLELKEKQFGERQEEVELERKKLIEKLELKEKQLEEQHKEVELKNEKNKKFFEELDLKEKQVEERCLVVELRNKKFAEELELKEKQLEEHYQVMELEKKKFEELSKKIELKEKHLEKQLKEVELGTKKVLERPKELELKEKQLLEQSKKLETEVKKFMDQSRELVLKERQLEERCRELDGKEIRLVDGGNTHVKIKAPNNFVVKNATDANLRPSVTMDGKALQIFLNKSRKYDEKTKNEVLTALGLSSDPANLVLDAMEGFYPPRMAFKGSVVKKSCNFLLEQLMALSPPIKSHVREAAKELAFDWRTKMRRGGKNYIEFFGFFRLLASYSLTSAFNANDLLNDLATVAQYGETPEFLRVLGLEDKASCTTVLVYEVAQLTCGFVQILINKKQYLDAVRFICAFELVKEFRPRPLLTLYLCDSKIAAKTIRKSNESVEARVMANEKRVADLRAVIKCIEDHKLESELPLSCSSQISILNEKKFSVPKSTSTTSTTPTAPTAPINVTTSSPTTACIASPAAAIRVTSPIPTPASTVGSIVNASPNPTPPITGPTLPITAPTSSTSVISPSPTTPLPSATIFESLSQQHCGDKHPQPQHQAADKRHRPQLQDGNKHPQPQHQYGKKHPHQQQQGGNKRPQIALSSEVPLRASSFAFANTNIVDSLQTPHQQPNHYFTNQGASYSNSSAGHYSFTGYQPINPQMDIIGFRELELRIRDVEERIKGVELKEKEFEEQRREVVLKGKQIEEVELKEKKLEERLRRVELENKTCTERIKEFESKEKQVVEACEAHVKLEPVDYSMDANLHFSVKMDGKALQIFLNEHCKHNDKMKNEVFIALGLSSDPAKLVLDAMEGFYPPRLRKDDVEFKEVVVKTSCNLLLEQLMKISPPIKPHVRKEAMRLAFNWMTKMRVDDQQYLEVLGFFNLLAAYGLGSAFDSDELISRLVIIARNRQTPEFLCLLGLADKIPGKLLMLELDGESVPPGPLLRDYLNGSKIEARRIRRRSKSVEAQIEATNKRVADLMVVLKCVEDYKLESEFSPNMLKQQIKDVERQHLNRNTNLSNLGCKSQPPNLSEKKRLAPKVASSSAVLASKSFSATKPALKSMAAASVATSAAPVTITSPSPTAASIASPVGVTSCAPMAPSVNPVAPIAVTSTSTTAASTATSTVVTSPSSTTASITAFTSQSTVAGPSSTSASPPALIPKTEPQCQGGKKRSLLQYKDFDKCPQEQHQGRNKRPRAYWLLPCGCHDGESLTLHRTLDDMGKDFDASAQRLQHVKKIKLFASAVPHDVNRYLESVLHQISISICKEFQLAKKKLIEEVELKEREFKQWCKEL
ncbi:unnamed protein product [Dovyalis caffra]|uniref:FRIGIDA-like protein n=1 Tax=Dovyalis caffra TaxID=77055 RepID=A0AAV1RVZ0_9ROSI|nr:unnamed protein product [Dovyalis caffra]